VLVFVGETLKVPVFDWLPDQAPDAVQLEEFVADQLSVTLPPREIEFSLAAKVTAGSPELPVSPGVLLAERSPKQPVKVTAAATETRPGVTFLN
jgi:hypothetical protein